MPKIKEQVKVNSLLDQMYEKITQYRESVIKNEVFEIRKKILLQIKKLQKEITFRKNKKP